MAKLNKINCPTCQSDIGIVHIIDHKAHLDDGLMMVRVGFRRCHVCGRVYYWDGDKFDAKYAGPIGELLAVSG